jgi:hypothetical protein
MMRSDQKKKSAKTVRRNQIIISASAILLLTAGILALLLSSPPAEELPPDDEPFDWDNIYGGVLINEEPENIESIEVSPRDSGPYILVRDNETEICELITPDGMPDPLFPGHIDRMHLLFRYAADLKHLDLVEEDADDGQLKIFGFDDPVIVWRVNLIDGTSIEMAVGGQVLTEGEARYARRTDSREVYLMAFYQVDSIVKSMEELYDLSFVPLPGPDNDWTQPVLDHILIEKDGESSLELNRRSEEEMFHSETGMLQFQLLSPIVADASDESVQIHVIEPIKTIVSNTAESLTVEEINPEDLSVYGLDSPVRLTVTLESGWSGSLLIGRHDPEREGMYLMIEGKDVVILHKTAEYPFLRVSYAQLRSSILWMRHIGLVSSITFEMDGTTRVLEFEHRDNNALTAKMDGIEFTEDNARRLFSAVQSLTHDGETGAAVPAPLMPDYRFTKELADGGRDTVELYRLGDTQEYLIVRNGVNQGVYIYFNTLQRILLSRFDLLSNGEDLPLVF